MRFESETCYLAGALIAMTGMIIIAVAAYLSEERFYEDCVTRCTDGIQYMSASQRTCVCK